MFFGDASRFSNSASKNSRLFNSASKYFYAASTPSFFAKMIIFWSRCGANRTSACGRDDLSRAFLRGTMGALPGSRIITNNTHRRADTVVQAEPTLVLSKDK